MCLHIFEINHLKPEGEERQKKNGVDGDTHFKGGTEKFSYFEGSQAVPA
jgi:hypothetical protein